MSRKISDLVSRKVSDDLWNESKLTPQEKISIKLFDEFTKRINQNNYYQLILILIYSLTIFITSVLITFLPIQKNIPEYYCLDDYEYSFYLGEFDYIRTINSAEFKSLQKQDIEKVYTKFANVFTPTIRNLKKVKFFENEHCIKKYCYDAKGNSKNNLNLFDVEYNNRNPNNAARLENPIMHYKTFENNFNLNVLEFDSHVNNKLEYGDEEIDNKKQKNIKLLLVNYESMRNFVTVYDAFCDYEDFFANIFTYLNIGRILGGLVVSYVVDSYGRTYTFNYLIYSIVITHLLPLIIPTRFVIYLFMFLSSVNNSIYFLIIYMSSETLTQKNYAITNTIVNATFSFTGVLILFLDYLFKDYYIIFYLILISIVFVYYFSRKYFVETFAFCISKKLYRQAYENLEFLNKLLGLNFENDDKVAADLKELKKFINIYYCNHSSDNNIISIPDWELKNSRKVSEEVVIKKTIDLLMNREYKNSDDNIKDKKKKILEDLEVVKIEHSISHGYNIYEKNKTFLSNIMGPYRLIFIRKKYFRDFLLFLPHFISINVIYFSQIFNVEKLSDNIHLVSTILFASELFGETFSGYLTLKFERKKLFLYLYSSLSILYFLMYIISNTFYKLILLFFSSSLLTISYVILYLYSGETFDVEVKSCMGTLLNNSYPLVLIFMQIFIEYMPDLFLFYSILMTISLFFLKNLKETFKGYTE